MATTDIVPATDDAKMNMTPMIDITFLLVVFFMLTIDLSSKEFFPVDLPYARMGVDDKPVPGEVKRFVINLTRDGRIIFKGNTFELTSPDAGIQDDNIVALRTALRQIHDSGGGSALLREPDGASKVPVMIHADWGTKWKYVQWVMQACAHPDIKIYKLQFAIKVPKPEDGN